ncbi:MAG: tRNA lysidine(34) synthetase TilS [Acidobacteria bacterium]|nr:tRNA lysidine(34) synthetase TilS [Acidobacteriota bacterium]MBV9477552.1 tRNA lysidine(34) synthetase TilS [Acidobacteriota bacterium]
MVVEALRAFLREHEVAPCRIVVAVSGGVDSTALLLACAALRDDGFAVVAAHVNHHLRGDESDADEAFVRALCARYDLALEVADGTLDPERVRARGIEAAAREVRYARLQEIRARTNAKWIVTAHQKNDQAETVLMRLLTDSGIAGLRGIHPIRDDRVLRPLLDVTRAQLEAFVREHDLTPRHDSSNDDPRFLRNRVRALLRELNATDNLANVARDARAQWPILERAIDDAERVECTARETRFLELPHETWLLAALLRRHIRRLDPDARDFDATRLAHDLDRQRRISVTKHLELVRDARGYVLRKHRHEAPPPFAFEITPNVPTHLEPLAQTLHLVHPARDGHQRFQLPRATKGVFTVRNRRGGDRFQPLGMDRPKKLKDFLIDRKIAAEVRDSIPLLLCGDEIVWVAGVEISERFKVTDPAGELYEVWLEGSR